MVRKTKNLLLSLCLGGICTSCTYDLGGMLAASSSVQERFENSMSPLSQGFHTTNIICDQSSYSFLIATDLHIKDEDWDRVGRFMTRAADSRNLMTLLLGDYMYIAGTSLNRLSDSIHARKNLRLFPAIGNHDVYQDGYSKTYQTTFGPTCYYFKVTGPETCDLFIIIDSANGTLGNGQFAWLQSLLSEERGAYRHCFVFTHANFFGPAGYVDVISTYPVEEQMKLMNIFSKQDVTAVFTGHSHRHDETKVRGVKYITLNPWFENDRKKGEYCRVTCTPEGNVDFSFGDVPGL